MRRHGDLYKLIATEDNVTVAFARAARGKRRRPVVRKVEAGMPDSLYPIVKMLKERQYVPSDYRTKKIFEPKERLIYMVPFFPDRIIHHAIMNVIEPIWDSLFIDDSYACRPGKGIHSGSRRTMQFVRRYRYCLKCDISKFYPSIDHDILIDIIKRKIKCKPTLDILEKIIRSVPGNKNVPIGNYTSQWFGNLYMNELDMMVKHKLKITGYIRYCDDFCLFHDDKKYLLDCATRITHWLAKKLKLSLSKSDIFPVSSGVDFLGYRHFPGYILLRKSTAKRMKKKIKALPSLLESGAISPVQYKSSLASIHGWLSWANTHNFALSINIKRMLEDAK